VIHGLSIQARDGAPRAELGAIVAGAMAAWNQLTGGPVDRPPQSTRRRSKPPRRNGLSTGGPERLSEPIDNSVET
jgi:hypothetical protein